MNLKRTIRALLPAPLLSSYHWLASWATAIVYGLPGRRLFIIGVTGTKGKTSTASMLWHILERSGQSTALLTTAFLALGQKTWLNDLKMTMPGRGKMQKFLRQARQAGCKYVVIETSSEGLAQWRHLGLAYKLGVFTNLAPEHLEAHGSFAKYRAAKTRLFKFIAKSGGLSIINLDDGAAEHFISQAGKKVWGYTFHEADKPALVKVLSGKLEKVSQYGVEFTVQGEKVELPIGGEFNAYNALAAITTAQALGVSIVQSVEALQDYPGTPGRLEFVQHTPFAVVVDYAHTTESLEAVYKILKGSGKLIAVLGSCGGGRDKAKRVPLGRLAGKYADYVIVTDEDPYDEPPRAIMESVAVGVRESGKKDGQDNWIIEDRRQAIHKALSLAQAGDTVVITGKGAEQFMCMADNKKIPWDDRLISKEELNKLSNLS